MEFEIFWNEGYKGWDIKEIRGRGSRFLQKFVQYHISSIKYLSDSELVCKMKNRYWLATRVLTIENSVTVNRSGLK